MQAKQIQDTFEVVNSQIMAMEEQEVLLKDWLLQAGDNSIDRDTLVQGEAYFRSNRKNFTREGKLNFANASFTGQDLRGIDLTHYDFSWANFLATKVDKEGFIYLAALAKKGLFNLKGIDIRGISLVGVDLHGIDFDGVDLSNVKFDRTAILSVVDDAKIGRVSLKNIDLSAQDLRGGVVNEPSLGISGFEYFDLEGVNFEGANFVGAELSGARLDGASFKGCNMQGVKMVAAYARNAVFENANLSGAKLCHTDFTGSNFDHATLTGSEV